MRWMWTGKCVPTGCTTTTIPLTLSLQWCRTGLNSFRTLTQRSNSWMSDFNWLQFSFDESVNFFTKVGLEPELDDLLGRRWCNLCNSWITTIRVGSWNLGITSYLFYGAFLRSLICWQLPRNDRISIYIYIYIDDIWCYIYIYYIAISYTHRHDLTL